MDAPESKGAQGAPTSRGACNQCLRYSDDRAIVWFDIDNTLYSATSKIADAMGERIHAYFTSMGWEDAEASEIHQRYYKTYGSTYTVI